MTIFKQTISRAVVLRDAADTAQDVVLTEELQLKRVPGNIVTASAIPAVNARHEDFAIIVALNVALAAAAKDAITTSRAVELHGVFQVNNNEAVAHEFRYANGGTADDEAAVIVEATAASAAVYEYPVVIVTDNAGNIKWEVDDRTKIDGIVFALTGYRYVQDAAE